MGNWCWEGRSTGVEGISDYVLVAQDTGYVETLARLGTKFHTDRDRFGETSQTSQGGDIFQDSLGTF